ncbi:hypothetical protein AMTRI_Chr09g35040 [Amborella trichopoda]|uniref:Pseudouridine synthase I TruA alpha/beta domain-containing protein n=1 Tax=Amborella trichopoda TaxID=13333 RepID=W1NLE6_AMBTC|nr:tRNA pseudouridine synthase A, mitochondrial [Amborella trichopoda]ERM96301.1 hypothetical protein AMTR_s00001p00184260 [Amborella trichopoda]|eukprot:XP_006828885.1 tRNA pseudouridine synthase A, mitochondrial [Amborella trichopoda]
MAFTLEPLQLDAPKPPSPKRLKMTPSTTDDENASAPKKRFKKRKIAIFLAYCGVGYQGMQRNPGAKTIEGDLELALFRAGAIAESDFGDPRRVDWMRSARTDKGVSAIGQVVSGRFFIDPPGMISRLNAHLPEQIVALGFKRVTSSFNAKKFCDRRRYVYLLPVFALDPSAHPDREAVAASLGSDNELVKCTECSERGRKVPGVMGHGDGRVTVSGDKVKVSESNGDAAQIRENNEGGGDQHTVSEENGSGAQIRFTDDDDGGAGEIRVSEEERGACEIKVSEGDGGSNETRVNRRTIETKVSEDEVVGASGLEIKGSEVETRVSENDAGFTALGTDNGVQGELYENRNGVSLSDSREGNGKNLQHRVSVDSSLKNETETEIHITGDQPRDGDLSNGVTTDNTGFIYSEEVKERFNKILKQYVGTHNFHNLTTRTKAECPSAFRYILSFEANEVVTVDGIDFIKCVVLGQSFMLHQIRKMVGLAVAIMRGCAPDSMIATALRKDLRINVPTAPELGLFLDECLYTSYNQKWSDSHEELSLKDYAVQAEEFKMKHIYSHIASTEHKEGLVALWLHSLNQRNYPDFQMAGIDGGGGSESIAVLKGEAVG